MITPMRKVRAILLAAALATVTVISAAPPAFAPVCQDWPGGCCEDIEILGKVILPIDC